MTGPQIARSRWVPGRNRAEHPRRDEVSLRRKAEPRLGFEQLARRPRHPRCIALPDGLQQSDPVAILRRELPPAASGRDRPPHFVQVRGRELADHRLEHPDDAAQRHWTASTVREPIRQRTGMVEELLRFDGLGTRVGATEQDVA